MDEAHRFLEMIRREMSASDVRLELGLLPPPSTYVTAPLANGVHLVVHFDGSVTTDFMAAREKLLELVEAFRDVAEEAAGSLAAVPAARPSSLPPGHATAPELALTEALEALVVLAKAELALVIDDTSPEIWGSSDPELLYHSTDDAIAAARLDARLTEGKLSVGTLLGLDEPARREALAALNATPNELNGLARQLGRLDELAAEMDAARWLRRGHAVAEARGVNGEHLGRARVYAHHRSFAGIYQAILVYPESFSELHAEGALLRALPTIEKLVTSLPPRDPASGGAKVAVLRRLRRV